MIPSPLILHHREPGVQISRQVPCAEPPQGAAERMVAAKTGPPFVWQAQRLVNLECRFRGRRSTQSLQEELRNAWSPLGRGRLAQRVVNLECRFRSRRSAQSLEEELRNVWLPLGSVCLLVRFRGRRSTQSL